MAVWPLSTFTLGIYRLHNPQSTLHLAAVFHVLSPLADWHLEWCRKQVNPRRMAVRLVEASVKDFGTRCNLVVLLLLLATMLGCSALNASQPSTQSATGSKTTGIATSSGQISVTPKNVAFGNVQVGNTQSQSVSLSNSGKGVVTITHASVSGQGFALAG